MERKSCNPFTSMGYPASNFSDSENKLNSSISTNTLKVNARAQLLCSYLGLASLDDQSFGISYKNL